MELLPDTHSEYVLDALQRDLNQNKEKIVSIMPEMEYTVQSLIEIALEIAEREKMKEIKLIKQRLKNDLNLTDEKIDFILKNIQYN